MRRGPVREPNGRRELHLLRGGQGAREDGRVNVGELRELCRGHLRRPRCRALHALCRGPLPAVGLERELRELQDRHIFCERSQGLLRLSGGHLRYDDWDSRLHTVRGG